MSSQAAEAHSTHAFFLGLDPGLINSVGAPVLGITFREHYGSISPASRSGTGAVTAPMCNSNITADPAAGGFGWAGDTYQLSN